MAAVIITRDGDVAFVADTVEAAIDWLADETGVCGESFIDLLDEQDCDGPATFADGEGVEWGVNVRPTAKELYDAVNPISAAIRAATPKH